MTRLLETTTAGFSDRLDDVEVALLPTGAVEQHGPALPLGTDFLIAETLAGSLDRDDVVVLPGVPVGLSDHHRQWDGTLSTDPETFVAHVADIVESMATHGVRKTVVVNGHAGNTDALSRAARQLRDAGVAFAVPWNWFSDLDEECRELVGNTIGHANEVETTMIYAVEARRGGTLVREEALEEAEAGAGGDRASVSGARVEYDSVQYTDSGAIGSPTAASREASDRLFEAARGDLDALVSWLADHEFADLLPPGHR